MDIRIFSSCPFKEDIYVHSLLTRLRTMMKMWNSNGPTRWCCIDPCPAEPNLPFFKNTVETDQLACDKGS